MLIQKYADKNGVSKNIAAEIIEQHRKERKMLLIVNTT
jgi:hypothetical protein